MTRNFRALGLALIAVFAMAAFASSASAHYEITSNKAQTHLTGIQGEGAANHTFTTAGQTIQCTGATFTGTMASGAVSEVTVTPVYSGCTYSSGTKVAHVTMNGCAYKLLGATTPDGKHGTVYVECPEGKVIEVHLTNFNAAETCTLTIGTQTATEGYTATNSVTDPNHIDIHATARVVITPHGKGGCPLLVSGLYKGTTTVEGYTDGQPHTLANKANLDVH